MPTQPHCMRMRLPQGGDDPISARELAQARYQASRGLGSIQQLSEQLLEVEADAMADVLWELRGKRGTGWERAEGQGGDWVGARGKGSGAGWIFRGIFVSMHVLCAGCMCAAPGAGGGTLAAGP